MDDTVNTGDLVRIEHVISSYGAAVDKPDFALLESCFTEDAVVEVDFPGVYDKRIEGYADIEEHIRGLHSAGATRRHVITNHLYTTDGDKGSGQSVFTAYQWADGKLTMTVGGSYQDTLVKTDGSWRISHRHSRIDWQERGEDQIAGRP